MESGGDTKPDAELLQEETPYQGEAEESLEPENEETAGQEDEGNGEQEEEGNMGEDGQGEMDAEDETAQAEDDDDSAKEPLTSTKLFVGGLSKETKEADVKEYFSQHGQVVECIVGTTKAGSSKGYGFIRMSTLQEAEAVLRPTEPHSLHGRVIVVKKHITRTANITERKLRLVIRNLDKEKTTEETLKAHFSQFGNVTECSISMGTEDGKPVSRGLGFITMSNADEVEAVLSSNVDNTQTVDGVSVSVKPALSNKYKQFQLYVGNLQRGVTTVKGLRKHFDQFGTVMEVSHGHKLRNSAKVQRGFAYIRMSCQEDYDAVVRAHESGHTHTLEGRLLDVRTQDTRQDHDKFRRLWFSGLNMEKTREADLLEHFSSFGTVVDCVIIRHPPFGGGSECKSKGYGFVMMADVDQIQAILKKRDTHVIHDKPLAFNRAPSLKLMQKQWKSSHETAQKRPLQEPGYGAPPKKMKGQGYGPDTYAQGYGGLGSLDETYYEDSPSGYVPMKVSQRKGARGSPGNRGRRQEAWQDDAYWGNEWMETGGRGPPWNASRGGQRGGARGGQRGGPRGGQRGKQRGKNRPY